MKLYQIIANEQFFSNTRSVLSEGGVFIWKDIREALIKRGDKLECTQKAFDEAKAIVSKEYFEKHFELKK